MNRNDSRLLNNKDIDAHHGEVSTDKISTLRQTEMFGELDDESLRLLTERAVERRLASGEVLFIAGEEAHGLYVIAEGAVRAVRVSPEGREQVLHVERAPTTIAEVPAFDDEPFPSTAVAETDARGYFIDKLDGLFVNRWRRPQNMVVPTAGFKRGPSDVNFNRATAEPPRCGSVKD